MIGSGKQIFEYDASEIKARDIFYITDCTNKKLFVGPPLHKHS